MATSNGHVSPDLSRTVAMAFTENLCQPSVDILAYHGEDPSAVRLKPGAMISRGLLHY